jgi:uncharacterized repeat protein (TIGR01451 family)
MTSRIAATGWPFSGRTIQATAFRCALILTCLSVATTLYAAPGDDWSPREQNRDWQAVASSADGSKLAAVVFGGRIYTSSDWGVTWTARESSRYWFSVASSASGTRLVAVDADYATVGGYIYTSTDSGVTWTPRENPRRWSAVASSADGNKLVAAESFGLLYTSTDAGVTWTPRDSARGWVSVASSADGNMLAAVEAYGRIYTSTDAGVTWTPRDAARYWLSITSSTDGSRLAAVVYGGQIYTSTDAGVTWTPRDSARNWVSIASSADGTVLMAVEYGPGRIYISRDSGATWAPRESARMWYGAAMSADGSSLAAVVAGGQIYTSGRCLGNVGDLITFDCVPNDTVVDNVYATSFGVTFSNPLGGSIYARNSSGFSPSLPNAVSVRPSSATVYPFFDATDGAVEAHFATPQRSISVDARPVGPVEFLGTLQNRPFLEAYDSSHTFLGRVLYGGPLPTGCCFEVGPMETLTFSSSTANISYARFSSQVTQSSLHTYGLFDNLRWFGTAPRLFNTGVDNRGNPLPNGFLQLPDSHYMILTEPTPQIPGPAQVTTNNGWPITPGAWMANSAVSQWISPHANENCLASGGSTELPGTYLYRTTFDMTGFNAARMSISGRSAADDGVTAVLLNGVVAANPVGAFDSFTPFAITGGFVAGINSLDFVVQNGPGGSCNPSGLRVEMNASVDAADLAIAMSDSPDPVAVGANLTYTLTVRNLGPNPATSVTAAQPLPSGVTFVSASSTLGSCSLAGSTVTCALGTMSSGGIATITVIIRPTSVGSLVTSASVSAAAADPNAGNNSTSATTTVATTGIDLVETAVSNPPASAQRGSTFAVSDTVMNGGGVTSNGSTTRYYLSADTLRNSGDLLLAGTRTVPPLAATGTSSGPASLTVPSTAKGGTFRLLACADDTKVNAESNETNNCIASATTIQIVGPDLVVTTLSNPSATLVLSTPMSVTDTTTNVGTLAASSSITRYFLSLNTVKNAGDVLLSGTRPIGVLNPGNGSTAAASVTVPAGTAAGTYYLLACADNTSLVAELNETNNCKASSSTLQLSGPDLVETAVSFATATVAVGHTFTASDTVLNQGGAGAGASVTRYLLSLDTVRNSGDRVLTGNRSVLAAAAGQSRPGSTTLTVPSTTPAGQYYLLACSDFTRLVAETVETNNCLASATRISITP